MEFKLTSEYPVPAEKLFRMQTSPDYLKQATGRARGTNVAVTVVTDNERTLALKIDWTEPSRGADGKPTDQLEPVTETHTWDRAALRLDFERTMPDKPFVKTRGTRRIEAAGPKACRLTVEGEIEIKLPIIGRSIAKRLVESLTRKWPDSVAWDKEYLAGMK